MDSLIRVPTLRKKKPSFLSLFWVRFSLNYREVLDLGRIVPFIREDLRSNFVFDLSPFWRKLQLFILLLKGFA